MKHICEIKNELENYYDFELKQQEVIKNKVVEYSNKQAQPKFIEEIRTNFEIREFSGLCAIYDSLKDYPEKWGGFFVEEYQRLYKAAEKSKEPLLVTSSLDEILLTELTNFPEHEKIISLLTNYLNHKRPQIRYCSLLDLCDWLNKVGLSNYPNAVSKIKEKLEDPNWKIRVNTYKLITVQLNLKISKKLKTIDKLKSLILNTNF
jgi:hypothetical protein